MRFPKLIHVTIDEPSNDDPYLICHLGGVQGLDDNGQRVAIYKLVSVGKVAVTRQYIETKKSR